MRRGRGIRSWSLRTRITVVATAAVAVVMILGSLGFHAVLAGSIRGATERAAEARAEQIAARIEAEGPRVLADLDDEPAELRAGSAVIAASPETEGAPLPTADSGDTARYDDEPVLIVREELDDGRELVLAAPLEDDTETLGTVALLLAVSTAAVVLLVAAVTWWVVGRALQPVARIRADVDDITGDRLDRRIAEPPTHDEIAALAVTMNRMLDRLDAAATAQRRFVSDASHELRSPLATIRQHGELARAHPEATSLDDLAEVVVAEGVRMQELVDALLLLARLDEHAPQRRTSVDLDDLALAEVSRLRAGGSGASEPLTVDGSGISAARVTGDPAMLGRLVRNLADNAARHARSRVRIATAVSSDGRWGVLHVDDDGSGVPVGERDRIFERFVRLDEARTRDAGGSGLGLAIVRGIAEAGGGSVAVSDAPLGGARFTVTLPADEGASERGTPRT